ncbi:hypothetical protein PIROE2DRAFT_62172 [Piromyces sp. E2]|nr:hypothetical protein PIROE2DRAFT_62172 [Piromyces sp. E2]|eukprot:OUM62010.1 hypothetical protein PIROE2DRAFT_62172 [Piromyces sp. E2]
MAVIQIDNYDNVRQPDHEIAVVGKQYVTSNNTSLCIKFEALTVVDHEGNEQYKFLQKGDGVLICNLDGTPILNCYAKQGTYRNMYVYKGEGETDQLVHIETSKVISKDIQSYLINILNIARNESEQLEMHYNKSNQCYYIYSNKDKANESLIGIIKKEITRRLEKEYKIEIAPMVDRMLLLSIGGVIVRLDFKKSSKNEVHQEDEKANCFGACCFIAIACIGIAVMFFIFIGMSMKGD